MTALSLALLIDALGTPGASYVLGAGASAPHVPTMAQLPEKLAAYASRLTSFPASKLPDSPLRRLIGPMIERAANATTIEAWKPAGMTPATIAVALEDTIAAAHWQPLPQYAVFRFIPLSATVISFNWDGLAGARCQQRVVLHPHGILLPRLSSPTALDDLLDFSQLYDGTDARDWLLPELVMPGEEESTSLASMREKVFDTWRRATAAIVIGYSFGIGSDLDYDRVWLDIFTEAFRINSQAAIHLLSPAAVWLRGELTERLQRSVNVHAWPLNWHTFTAGLLRCASTHGLARMSEFGSSPTAMEALSRLPFGDAVAAT